MTERESIEYCIKHPQVGEGWQQRIVEPFLRAILDIPGVRIDQIKEKFGTLRLYVVGPPWVLELADRLETVSESVCEDCGALDRWGMKIGDREYMTYKVETKPGLTGWVKTLCQVCWGESGVVGSISDSKPEGSGSNPDSLAKEGDK